MKQETDFSELDHIDYLDTKHSSLKFVPTFFWFFDSLVPWGTPSNFACSPEISLWYRDIALEFQTAATIINARWLNSPKPPEMSIRHQKRPANRASVPLPRAVSHAASSPGAEYALHPTMPCQPGTRDIAPLMPQSDTTETDTSPMSDDAIHESVQDILDTLKSRGKDNHVCPWGNRCTKGGVGPDGNVVVFERNSAFRYATLLLSQNTRLTFSNYTLGRTWRNTRDCIDVICQGARTARALRAGTSWRGIRRLCLMIWSRYGSYTSADSHNGS
jgi:hypothetical protein